MEKSKGFTIIELLVVLAIIAIIPLIVISGFPSVRSQFSLSDVAYRFSEDVRTAQTKGLSALPYKDSFGVQQPADGYGIYADLDSLGNTTYYIYAEHKPANNYYDPLDSIIKTITLGADSGIIIQKIGTTSHAGVSIVFSPGHNFITLNQNHQVVDSLDIIFAVANDPTKTKTVSINASGLIEVR
jgi:prepilin-type N-terminal cleavage/methylation domain-containing protein